MTRAEGRRAAELALVWRHFQVNRGPLPSAGDAPRRRKVDIEAIPLGARLLKRRPLETRVRMLIFCSDNVPSFTTRLAAARAERR